MVHVIESVWRLNIHFHFFCTIFLPEGSNEVQNRFHYIYCFIKKGICCSWHVFLVRFRLFYTFFFAFLFDLKIYQKFKFLISVFSFFFCQFVQQTDLFWKKNCNNIHFSTIWALFNRVEEN